MTSLKGSKSTTKKKSFQIKNSLSLPAKSTGHLIGSKVKIYRNRPYSVTEIKYRSSSRKNIMSAITASGDIALYRSNIFGSEIIWGDYRFMLPNASGRRSIKNLFIYSMVKRNATEYIRKNKQGNTNWNFSTIFNDNAKPKGRELIGVDIDGAYWMLALKFNIISEITFSKGLQLNQKRLLVSALSTLGQDKGYTVYRNGKETNERVVIKGNDQLKKIYKKIRHSCYGYMKQLAKKLGNNFVAYKTDCIYFFKTDRNLKLVKNFLDAKGFDYKMVEDFDKFMNED